MFYKIVVFFFFSFIILQSCNFNNEHNASLFNNGNDSISLWIGFSKQTNLSIEKRRYFLIKSYNALTSSNISDTLKSRTLSKIAYQYLKLKDTSRFKRLNTKAYQIAITLKDTLALADTHWNKANFFKNKEVYDSAYYHYHKAYNYFETIDNQFYAAKMLYGMAFIKGRFRDYSGSEILIIKAISKYKRLGKYKSLYASYNHLAVLQSDIKEYDKSLFYHMKALEYLDKLKDKEDFYRRSLNNLGFAYLDKLEYAKSLGYFNQILEDEGLKSADIESYARVLGNRAYCKLLYKDTIGVKADLFESLKINDSLKNKGGIVISKIRIAEYYAFARDSTQAVISAKEANQLAKEIRNSRDYLMSLKLLSKLDKKTSKTYLEKHIAYSDSLQDSDRKIQNKFARIAYETDEYIEETIRLSQQKIKLLVICLTILFMLSLVYYIRIQKAKSEKLLLETEQQKANEKVYILTMRQQVKLEEEKTKERNRISEELHDGVLGKLFGIRIDLGFLDIKGSDETLKKHELFLEELQNIEKEIREVSHKLSLSFNHSEINFNVLINELIKKKSEFGHFTYNIEVNEGVLWENIHEVIKVNIYRIIQETLQNVVKYAKAKHVDLSFSKEQNNLVVAIKDNGVGFKVKRTKSGIGIKNIESRIEKLKGDFSIDSELNKGTTIYLRIPIQ